MQNFKDNAEINNLIFQFLLKVTYDKSPDNEWDCKFLNGLNRQAEAIKIVKKYFQKNDINSIGGQKNEDDFIEYVAKQIDRLIPIFCFMNANKSLSERYSSLLTRRIFLTKGKDFFPITQNLVYRYEQDFSNENEYIKKTIVTPRQLEFLQNLAQEQGFIIINDEYMTNENAKKIIAYLKGTAETEPRNFGFFVITV